MMGIVERLRVASQLCECDEADVCIMEKAADEIERLRAVRDIADLLVNECEGGLRPPSLGILARLESALAMEHKAHRALGEKPDGHR